MGVKMKKLLPILLFAYALAITTEDIYDNSYALIIGIDKYEHVRSLDYAVKDAEDIHSMLMDKFNFQKDNIILLKNKEATKASILREFSNITKKAEANDRVLIFFAGHGKTQNLPDGGEMGYLMPVNGDEKDLYISAIDMDELRKISLISEAKHILYLVDACYGGLASVGARGLNAKSTPDYLQKITQDKGRQMISAGGRGEEVIEKAEWGHSAFTKNLLSGLRDSKADIDKDGIITAQELGAYLKRKVTIDSNNQQTPKTRYLSTDEGEFVFINNVEKVIINDATINIVDTSSTVDYDLLAKQVAKYVAQENKDVQPSTNFLLHKNWELMLGSFPVAEGDNMNNLIYLQYLGFSISKYINRKMDNEIKLQLFMGGRNNTPINSSVDIDYGISPGMRIILRHYFNNNLFLGLSMGAYMSDYDFKDETIETSPGQETWPDGSWRAEFFQTLFGSEIGYNKGALTFGLEFYGYNYNNTGEIGWFQNEDIVENSEQYPSFEIYKNINDFNGFATAIFCQVNLYKLIYK